VNPIFVLDEVDKNFTDFGLSVGGSMELLTVLNHSFTDHYLDVECDLSKGCSCAMPVCLHESAAASGRMELLRLPAIRSRKSWKSPSGSL